VLLGPPQKCFPIAYQCTMQILIYYILTPTIYLEHFYVIYLRLRDAGKKINAFGFGLFSLFCPFKTFIYFLPAILLIPRAQKKCHTKRKRKILMKYLDTFAHVSEICKSNRICLVAANKSK